MALQIPRLSGGNLGRTKNLIHFAQAFIIFLAWALTIAIWTKGDGIDGRTVYYWILCWVSMPALIYLAAVPMWPRARRFGNVYAFATVDAIYAVFWFAAWVCLASYVAQGKSIGKSSSSDKDSSSSSSTTSSKRATTTTTTSSKSATTSSSGSGCANWAYGNEAKCNISTATTIIGVVILYVAAFNSNPAHDFEEDEDDFRSGRAGMGAASSRGDQDEDYALLQQSEVDDLGNRSAMHGAYDPTAPAPGGVLHDFNSTGYGGAHGQHNVPYTPSDYGSAHPDYNSSTMSGYGRV
ncbi:hypothetical protein N7526_006069 [Penicillium atrosanguineum]|nr:hypothetical protein N7526_006069 [Penicillium atrosanguineum]